MGECHAICSANVSLMVLGFCITDARSAAVGHFQSGARYRLVALSETADYFHIENR